MNVSEGRAARGEHQTGLEQPTGDALLPVRGAQFLVLRPQLGLKNGWSSSGTVLDPPGAKRSLTSRPLRQGTTTLMDPHQPERAAASWSPRRQRSSKRCARSRESSAGAGRGSRAPRQFTSAGHRLRAARWEDPRSVSFSTNRSGSGDPVGHLPALPGNTSRCCSSAPTRKAVAQAPCRHRDTRSASKPRITKRSGVVRPRSAQRRPPARSKPF